MDVLTDDEIEEILQRLEALAAELVGGRRTPFAGSSTADEGRR